MTATPWSEDFMKNYQWLDECLLSKQGTKKVFQPAWQAYRYLLGEKMYAYIGINDQNGRPIITLKLDPFFSNTLRNQYEDIVPGYYMNKTHWSSVYLDGEVPKTLLEDIVSASYDVMFSSLSKKAKALISSE